MSLQSKIRSAKRLIPPAAALLLAALTAIPASSMALAQTPSVSLVNVNGDVVERKKDGSFVARPVFSRRIGILFYGVRHPDTGDWVTAVYRVQGGEKRLRDGWEYSWEYPVLDEQPELDPERTFLLVMLAGDPGGGNPHTFHAVIPVHQPEGLWDRVIAALDPGRWVKALARWIIEGVHGTLCGVVERVSGQDAAACQGG